MNLDTSMFLSACGGIGGLCVLWAWLGPKRQNKEGEVLLPPPPPLPLDSLFPRDTLNDYQERAMYYHNENPNNISAYALGLCGEAGEFSEHIKKHLTHGKDLNRDALVLELGDALWYVAANAHLHGMTLDEVAEKNLQKLAVRWPRGFGK